MHRVYADDGASSGNIAQRIDDRGRPLAGLGLGRRGPLFIPPGNSGDLGGPGSRNSKTRARIEPCRRRRPNRLLCGGVLRILRSRINRRPFDLSDL